MKTKLRKLFLLATLFIAPNVYAASSCSYSEQAELNDIVSHVEASYEIVDINMGKGYDIDNMREDGTYPEVDLYSRGFKFTILNR